MFWGEVSGAVENYYVAKVGMSMIPNIFVQKLLPDKKSIELDSDGFHYTREIGGKKEKKVIVGDVNNVKSIETDAKIKKLNLIL